MTLQIYKQTLTQIILWIATGCVLGIAAIIPGLSIGTLAVVMGIYHKIIFTTTHLFSFSLLTKRKLNKTNVKSDILFILSLSFGIGISVFILSNTISHLINKHPIAIYSLFTGLILASIPDILKEIKNTSNLLGSTLIIALMFGIFLLTKDISILISHNLYLYIVSGFLACFFAALPGLSGSMALVLLGTYVDILKAIHHGNIEVLVTFILGGILGLICVLKILQTLLKQNRSWLFSLILAFIVGSLPTVFPYKFWNANNSESFLITMIGFIFLGTGIFYIIQYLSKRNN